MSTAATVLREREVELQKEIESSLGEFDLASPLTEAELEYAGMLGVLPTPEPKSVTSQEMMPLLRDIEDEDEPTTDAVEAFADRSSYNAQYARYMRCQALVALVAFTEGWSSFEEMALKEYVRRRKRENDEYRGEDPNKAFLLRVRQQTAEDFVKFIRAVMNEAIMTAKPALAPK